MSDNRLYAELDHADHLIRTAEYLAEQGLHRAACDVLERCDRSATMLPDQRTRLSDVAMRILSAMKGGPVAHSLSPVRPPLSWEDDDSLPVT